MIKKEFGASIAKARHRTGLTQEQLAAKVDLSSRYIQQLEAGKSFPSEEKLFALAYACKTSPQALLTPIFKKWVAEQSNS